MKLCVMAAVQGFAVHPAAELPRVCHSLTAQEISPTCSAPYESTSLSLSLSLSLKHTHSYIHTHTHTHTHTPYFSRAT
jgi:hypothetical protein